MIALRNNLPLVRFEDGQIMAFERDWLSSGLCRAAQRAGYAKWWLAEHVTESVTSYLGKDFDENVVTVTALQNAVESVLQVIGYSDVAEYFEPLPPPVRLSLVELAREAGAGYELLFFCLLQSRLREIVRSRALQVEFFGLQPCVKLLRSAKVWRRDCSGLRSEIVRFVRGELDASARANELQLQLS